jgi:hypothetical protein
MAILSKHVVMGKNLIASGSLAGEMKVGAISGSTGLTLNQMLIALDNNATATDASIAADAVHLGNLVTLSGVSEDAAHLGAFSGATISDNQTVKAAMQLLETKVESVESDSDSAESALDARLDIIEAGDSQAGSIAKAQADAQAFATTSINNLIDAAPSALNTLNELAAAMGDDANFGTTVTNAIAAVQTDVNNNEAVSDAVIGVSGGSHMGTFTGSSIADNQTIKQALQALETKAESAQSDIDANEAVSDAVIGVSGGSHLGTFTGSSIADDQTIKQALQALETKAEAAQSDIDANEAVADAVVGVGGASNLGAFSGGTIADNQTVKQALQAVETQVEVVVNNGFHTEKDGVVWKMGWGVNSPRLSFEIEADASVTMSVDKETA